jgi:hypothetical protein
MKNLLAQLKGGDRRSVRGVREVVDQVMAKPDLFPVLMGGMTDPDPLIRMRCADAVEKISAVRPEYLTPYKKEVIRLAGIAEQQEVRWHVAQLLSRLDLSWTERRRAVVILKEYLSDNSRIVKTFAMQALADIAVVDTELRPPIVKLLKRLTQAGSPAMKSRGRKLLVRLRNEAAAEKQRLLS